MSPKSINGLRSHIKNSKVWVIRCPNLSKSVKKKLGSELLGFLTHFFVFGYPDPGGGHSRGVWVGECCEAFQP